MKRFIEFIKNKFRRHPKLKLREFTLVDMVGLYCLIKTYLKIEDDYELAKTLYKQDIYRFYQTFKCLFGVECKIQEPMVAIVILKSGITRSGVRNFSVMIRGKNVSH